MTSAKLQRAYAQMIHGYAEWSWWITLTFKDTVTAPTANRILKKWSRRIATRMVRSHFTLAYVPEITLGGMPHFHALLAFGAGHTVSFRPDWADEWWKGVSGSTGFTRMGPYDAERGWRAALYLAKHGDPEIQIACPRDLPCRRKHGCREAPGPWHDGAW